MAAKTFEHINCADCTKRNGSIFCNTSPDILTNMSDAKSCTIYKKGEVIFREGCHPFGIFCIQGGKIKLAKQGEEGKEQILRLAKGGDVMGYRSLLVGERYNATATALEDSNVCFIPRENFMTSVQKDANLSFEVMKLLSSQLKEAETKITNLAQKPVRERIAETLLFLKETYGLEDDNKTIAVLLSREEIANLVGTATETTIRLLSEFNKDKVIELSGKKIAIQNMKELARIANVND